MASFSVIRGFGEDQVANVPGEKTEAPQAKNMGPAPKADDAAQRAFSTSEGAAQPQVRPLVAVPILNAYVQPAPAAPQNPPIDGWDELFDLEL